MLVLARKRRESIMIGDDIEVIVIESRDGQVRLGVRAPDEVRVHRREIWLSEQRRDDGEK